MLSHDVVFAEALLEHWIAYRTALARHLTPYFETPNLDLKQANARHKRLDDLNAFPILYLIVAQDEIAFSDIVKIIEETDADVRQACPRLTKPSKNAACMALRRLIDAAEAFGLVETEMQFKRRWIRKTPQLASLLAAALGTAPLQKEEA